MENQRHPFPQAKVARVPLRQCKVGPQAVCGKIILACGFGIFPQNPAQPGHSPFYACGMEPAGSRNKKLEKWNE